MMTERGPGRGNYDIYLPRFRTVIETKAIGKVSDSDKSHVYTEISNSPAESLNS